MDTLEAPRLPAADHPSTESDTTAFYPQRYTKGRHDEMKLRPVIHPLIYPIIHPNRTNIFFLKGKN
jgi:hypothetical protein